MQSWRVVSVACVLAIIIFSLYFWLNLTFVVTFWFVAIRSDFHCGNDNIVVLARNDGSLVDTSSAATAADMNAAQRRTATGIWRTWHVVVIVPSCYSRETIANADYSAWLMTDADRWCRHIDKTSNGHWPAPIVYDPMDARRRCQTAASINDGLYAVFCRYCAPQFYQIQLQNTATIVFAKRV